MYMTTDPTTPDSFPCSTGTERQSRLDEMLAALAALPVAELESSAATWTDDDVTELLEALRPLSERHGRVRQKRVTRPENPA